MSATPESADPAPATVGHGPHGRTPADAVSDIFLWRRKNVTVAVLLVATATFVALEAYQFNFITVASWVAMFVVTLMFLWGIIHRLLGKEAPELSRMEMSERLAIEMANTVRELVEEGVRWMFRIGAGTDWFAFAITVASLWLLSLIASRFDFLTFVYTGVVAGMTVPVIYVKYEHKIKEYGWRLKMQSQRCLRMIEEKLNKLKSRVAGQNMKEKKTE